MRNGGVIMKESNSKTEKELSLHELLITIQNELKVPKNLNNKFGNFKYRNAETIYENLKPLLAKYNVALVLTDDVVALGNRTFLKATAVLSNGKENIQVSSLAELALEKKGMDVAQITGSASSYARKYVLGGMFLLDDSQDIDSMSHNDNNISKNLPAKLASKEKVASVITAFNSLGISQEKVLETIGNKSLDSITEDDLTTLRKYFSATKSKLNA